MTALTNTRITIECRASGVPKPTVVWSNDNQKMNSDDGNKIQQEDGSSLIRVFKKGETVRYTCTATNVAGQDSASSTVEVVGKLHKCVTFTSFNYIALIVGLFVLRTRSICNTKLIGKSFTTQNLSNL